MKKIVILGCENSHANGFMKCIKENAKYSDVEVVGAYSPDEEALDKFCNDFGVKKMAAPNEAVGKIDGLVITARHGKYHYEWAKDYMKDGIPMFIDKPVVISEDDARALVHDLEENKIQVSGGSSLIYASHIKELSEKAKELGDAVHSGYFRAPVNPENPYGNFYFYSPHLVAMMCSVFGNYPNTVYAHKIGGKINCLVSYDNADVHLTYTNDCWKYFGYIGTTDSVIGGEFTLDDVIAKEFDHYYEILSGNKEGESYVDFVSNVFILNAIERSYESGLPEKINRF